MEETNELLKTLIGRIDNLEKEMKSGFTSVNKRLDGVEYELKKINTVIKYQDQYDNIPS
ncbi:hypothetical protein [Aquimarina algiphila]|uniref:hypothetical protein n=1 Tax=Aquimarina algiphila TaxID=2047982 RepID=UPI002492CE94|nr:hypothetical protein [Aquimarina algiphila]